MKASQKSPPRGMRSVKTPRPWCYAVAFLLLVALWVVALELWIKPPFLAVPGAAAPRRLNLFLLPPLLTVLTAYLLRVAYVRRELGRWEEEAIAMRVKEDSLRREEGVRQAAIRERKQFTLEILSLGLAVEYLRHAQIWEEIQSQERNALILSPDPEDYPSAREDKEKSQRERETEVMEHVLDWLTEEWAIPTFLAGPTLHNPRMMALFESNLMEALGHGALQGRALKVVEALHDEASDQLLQKVFDFMDRHPEVPAVLLVAEDGLVMRGCLRAEKSSGLVHECPRPQEAVTESAVAILLGRRDRADAMRALTRVDSAGLDVLKPYWEREPPIRSAGVFTASEWLPGPWSKQLLKGFAKLPVIGHLHRPQFAHFQSQGDASIANSLTEAWEAALEGLTEGGKHQQLFYDCGAVVQGRRLAPLSRAVRSLDPDFDVFGEGINLHRCLGNTGAASPFLGLALAAMASHRKRGIGVSVCLRREGGASLAMISPPTEADGQPDEGPDKAKEHCVEA